jgi:hypothetical protein
MLGFWQAQTQATQVQQQLQALTAQHAEATSAAKQQYQAQQEQLAQMAVAAHTQRAALEELSEQGRKSRNADRMSIVKKSYVQNGGDESVIRSYDAVMQQIAGLRKEAGEGHLTDHDLANSKGGYKKPNTSGSQTSKWELQSNGTYKKVPSSSTYYSRDRAALAEQEKKDEELRKKLAARNAMLMNVSGRDNKTGAPSTSAAQIPTIRTGGHLGHTSLQNTRELVPSVRG